MKDYHKGLCPKGIEEVAQGVRNMVNVMAFPDQVTL